MKHLYKPAETKEEVITRVNRVSCLAHYMASCTLFTIDHLNDLLKENNLEMKGNDKHLFNQLHITLKRAKYLIEDLEKSAFKSMGDLEEDSLVYEDTIHQYFYIFLLILDRTGTDPNSDLRAKAFVDIIEKYKSQKIFGLDTWLSWYKHIAFGQVDKAIKEGKYSKEDFKNLLQYENPDKELESKISGENS